jgi:hypothetical protein
MLLSDNDELVNKFLSLHDGIMSLVCKGECGGSTTPYQTRAIPSNLTRLQIRLKLLLLFIVIQMLFVMCVGNTNNVCVFQKTLQLQEEVRMLIGCPVLF